MLLRRAVLDAIVRGDVSVVFRKWARPTVRSGGTLKTAVGVLSIDAVDVVALSKIAPRDVRAAGYATKAELVADLATRPGKVYRVAVSFAGEDPRIALRKKRVGKADRQELDRKLARMDAASPWTRRYLELIAGRPGTRAPDLAESLGMETKPFKQRVRRLKALGLTESLKVGYRLSPRGRSYLRGR